MILSCNNINKSFDGNTILKDCSFHLNEHEKAAIVGINGAGKSTLFKIITGELKADSGTVVTAKDIRMACLSQHPDISTHRTIYEEMLSVKHEIIAMEEKLRTLEISLKNLTGQALKDQMEIYARLTHAFELQNGYAYQSEINGVLKGLGFSEEDYHRTIDTLSGGQKTRVFLSRLLLSDPDLILLDEPTNHLDLNAITWLEGFLSNYKGSVLVISHDRYFLDRIVTKVIEIEDTKSTVFSGTYSDYAVKKEQLRDNMLKQYYNQQREIKHQEQVIEKLKSFNREKSIKRAESREKLLAKTEILEKPKFIDDQMHLKLSPRTLSGNDVLSVTSLGKSFGNLTLFNDTSFSIRRGEKVGIIGNNGTGKTTILKIINGLLPPDTGEVKTGAKVEIGYYDQEHHVLNMDKTLFDEISDTYPEMTNTEIRNVLAAFLFTGEDVFKLVGELSGGERGRLSLAKLMLSNANFLILDEPTNHLDITSKEILENAINHYDGTVLYVSHDRYFINKTASRILELVNHKFVNYLGNYDYYLEKRDELTMKYAAPENQKQMAPAVPSENKLDWKAQKEEQARIRKRENALKRTEERIASLEAQTATLNQTLNQPEIASDANRLMELSHELDIITKELDHLYEEWESLSEE